MQQVHHRENDHESNDKKLAKLASAEGTTAYPPVRQQQGNSANCEKIGTNVTERPSQPPCQDHTPCRVLLVHCPDG
jgi:hypothetical protein